MVRLVAIRYAACEYGHKEIVYLLLHHAADPNALSSSSAHCSLSLPICCAVKKGYTDIVYLLLEHGADVNKLDGSGKSALMIFLELMISQRFKTPQASNPVEEGDLNILRSMLSAGGDANMISRRAGYSALHTVSSLGMCDVMMELIQHGADCNQLTSSGKSALDLACEKGYEEAVELLLKNGAELSNHNVYFNYKFYDSYHSVMPVLCTAAKSGSETMVTRKPSCR